MLGTNKVVVVVVVVSGLNSKKQNIYKAMTTCIIVHECNYEMYVALGEGEINPFD